MISKKLRWLEPAGQLIVLIAFGLQFFFVNPSIEASSKASAAFVTALQELRALEQQPDNALSGIAIDRARTALKDIQATAEDDKKKADIQRRKSSRVYLLLFVIGTLLAIGGKTASVAYSTKSKTNTWPASTADLPKG